MATIQHSSAGIPEFSPRLSTVDYLHMVETGVLGVERKVELIGGTIIEMSPAGVPHNYFLINAVEIFAPLVRNYRLAIQGSLTVAEGHVYDPDLMLLRPRPDRYKSKLPDAKDVLLIIEAAESSLPRDLQVKLPVYAAVGIPEYWVADLKQQTLVIHRAPVGPIYQSIESKSGDDVVSPSAAPQLSFAARQLFE
jgi:Uma2 family endonuclease